MDRYLKKALKEELKDKMVFVGGPRQVGKTTLASSIAPKKHLYLNWDRTEDRHFILKETFPSENFVIYDEIHKFKNWRNYVKGVYDKYKHESYVYKKPLKKILVTGSARLDYYRHSGDSLQGRYHYYRLHPFTVKELNLKTSKDIKDLLTLGGFPEPFLSGSHTKAQKWKKEYQSRVIYENIIGLELSQQLSQMELLLITLPEFVASPLSLNSLRHKLQVAHKTVDKWLDIFERLYFIYRLPPFFSNKLRSLRKEKKHYHYNWAEVTDEGARFENFVAGHLLKWIHFEQDYKGEDKELFYFRDTDKREIDFIVTKNKKPLQAIECKIKQKDISPHLKYFKNKFPDTECFQVYLEGKESYISKEGIHMMDVLDFLRRLI